MFGAPRSTRTLARRIHLLLFLLPHFALAADVQQVTIDYTEGQFHIFMQVILRIPPADAFNIMTQYERLGQINAAVQESRILQTFSAQKHRVKTITKVCVLWVCRHIKQIQDMTMFPQKHYLQATLTAQTPDFKSGHASWRFSPHPEGTELIFRSTLEPAFWIPPLIGPWAVANMLEAEAANTSNGIETQALRLHP